MYRDLDLHVWGYGDEKTLKKAVTGLISTQSSSFVWLCKRLGRWGKDINSVVPATRNSDAGSNHLQTVTGGLALRPLAAENYVGLLAAPRWYSTSWFQ